MKKKKRLAVLFTLLLIGALLRLIGPSSAKWRTIAVFYRNREIYAQAAEPILAGEPVPEGELPGVKDLDRWRSKEDGSVWIADFYVGGWGLVPSSTYWGFYKTTNGEPAAYQGADDTLSKDGDGWSWQQPAGDNTYYTEEICDGWYYYRASF